MEEAKMHITKWKKFIWKGYLLHDSNLRHLEKAKLWSEQKDHWLPGLQGTRGMNRQSIEGFWASESILYDTVVAATCHCTFVKAHQMRIAKSEPSCKWRTLGDNEMSA